METDILKQLKEQLTSFDDACKIEGLDPEKVIPDFAYFPEEDREAMQAHAKWVIMTCAANRIANGGEKWKPNFDDGSWKYETWWIKGSSGFRFVGTDDWTSDSIVGSRLCGVDPKVNRYLAETFPDIWNKYAL